MNRRWLAVCPGKGACLVQGTWFVARARAASTLGCCVSQIDMTEEET